MEPAGSRRWNALRAASVAAAAVLAYLFARHALATVFQRYDDEGYMLLGLDHYLRGGHLYSEVFSQYGPVYFWVHAGIFRLFHLPVTHDAGRAVTLGFWLASAGLGGYFVYRISRHPVPAAAAGLAMAVLMRRLASEPGHPQLEVLLGLMLACVAATFSGGGAMVLLGAIGAALVFTKINVGVFYLAALGLTLVCRMEAGRVRSAAVAACLAYAGVFPTILMRYHLPGDAVVGTCLLATATGLGTFALAARTAPGGKRAWRDLGYAAAGAAGAAALMIAEAVREGMTAATLMEGVVWAPLRHPSVFLVALPLIGAQVMLAAVAAWVALGLDRFGERWKGRAEWVWAAVGGVWLIAIPVLAASEATIGWILPLAPLGLLSVRGMKGEDAMPRIFVASLSATEFLQIYPIAGTQLAIAAAPLLLWGFVTLNDAAERVKGRFGAVRAGLTGGVLLAVLSTWIVVTGQCSQVYATPASGLRGASWLHLDAEREAGFRYLADEIRTNCDMLFTMPGMGSFNFWSGVPTPDGMNLTAWMRELGTEVQQRIVEKLKADGRSCAVYNDSMTMGWRSTPADLRLPLAHYVRQEMPKAAERMGYEIRVNPRRGAQWVDTTGGRR